jgi:hypothetical protein
MPNGKGSLDCSYCAHFHGGSYPREFGEPRLCRFHETILPKAQNEGNNRICGNFEPNEDYHTDNPYSQFFPLARRFAWFGIDLEPGVLYEFCYNEPPKIIRLAVLREPDYHSHTRQKPSN